MARFLVELASVTGGAYWYVLCQSASDYLGALPALLHYVAQVMQLSSCAAHEHTKNGPKSWGHSSKVLIRVAR
jgi:hypothetical protein